MRLTNRAIAPACALAGLVATYFLVGFQNLDFVEPITLSGDHTFMLGVIKDVINGVGRFNEQLGAPGHKDAYFFPLFDGSYKTLSWLTSRFSSDLFVAANWFYFVGITLMFGATFVCLRKLTVHPLLAAIAAVSFVLTPYFVVRVAGHDYLSLYYSVPFGATLPLFLAISANNKELARNAKTPFALVSILFIGTSGFYYAFFSCLFLSLAMIARAFNQRRLMPLIVCAAICCTVVTLLMFSAYGFNVLGLFDGSVARPPSRTALQQYYHGLEIGGALQAYSDVGLFVKKFADYQAFARSPDGMLKFAGEGNFPEWPGAFLTTVILAAPVAIFLSALSAQRNARSIMLALCFAFITVGLVFATRGGLGFIFNSIFTPAVRAQERILPFLMFFAIAAVCMACGALRSNFHRQIVSALVALGLLSGVISSFHGLSNKQAAYLRNPAEQAYRRSALDMLAAKDRAGLTQILQLPVMVWPEAPPRQQMLGYEHSLPYLLDRQGSPTRWSYGLAEGQLHLSVLTNLARDETSIPTEAKTLKFDGILVEKTGYAAAELDRLMNALQANGACMLSDDTYRALFSICK